MKISGPFFHDMSQENLYLKSELARCRKLIAELEASYFHQKNNKLIKENSKMKEKLQALTAELEQITTKEKHALDTSQSLNHVKAELLDKIVTLQELLQNETYKRKKEIDEKHRLHITNVRFEEENKNLHIQIDALKTAIQNEKAELSKANQQTAAVKDENIKLNVQIAEKEFQLENIKIEIDHIKDRILETKERLLQIEKTKEKLFQETILSYKRQLDESDAWIASQFADIDSHSRQTEEALEENQTVFEHSEHVENILEDVTEQVFTLQKQLDHTQSHDQSLDEKLAGWKDRAAEQKLSQKWVYKLEKKNISSQKKPK
ncbi:sporulation protein [Bacillus atrophaeus]